MITRSAYADLGNGDCAVITGNGTFVLELGGTEHFMTAAEAKDMWAKIGVLMREFAKWNG